MKAAEFDYVRADSVAAASAALAAAGPGEEHRIIAGGQTLVPLMAMRLARPTLLVDIDGIDGLDGIEASDDAVAIGAMPRQRTAELSPTVRDRLPLLAKALGFVGHLQTRNRGTVGGSLAHGDPAAEIPLVAVALDAELEAEGRAGRRTYPAAAFFEAPMATAIAADECLVEARFPAWNGARIGTGFQEVASRKGDFAIVAAAAQLALDGGGRCARIAAALGGVAPIPVRIPALEDALSGSRLEDGEIEAALGSVEAAIEPDDDLHATAAYRGRVARVLLGRAIREARAEALA
ncbi:MAG: FAD binding domain-containing protein [Defluviicoccus sp.]|nr:FAD binding domain-containing protein [Defluviicoccus sp.]